MKEKSAKGMNRRDFLGLSAIGLTGLTILPSYVINGVRVAPSDRVLLGTIGLGRQGNGPRTGVTAFVGLFCQVCWSRDRARQAESGCELPCVAHG
mgnify:CR=1 FL=1